ncbi:MAG: hypothetical protein RLO50_06535 [Azospirillaceae bacterium]
MTAGRQDGTRLKRRARRKIAAAILVACGAAAYIVAAMADRWLAYAIFGTQNRADLVYYVLVAFGFVLIVIAGGILITTARLDAEPSDGDRSR